MAQPNKTRHAIISEITEMHFKRISPCFSEICPISNKYLQEKSNFVEHDTSNSYLTLPIGFTSKSVFIEELKIPKHILRLFLD